MINPFKMRIANLADSEFIFTNTLRDRSCGVVVEQIDNNYLAVYSTLYIKTEILELGVRVAETIGSESK